MEQPVVILQLNKLLRYEFNRTNRRSSITVKLTQIVPFRCLNVKTNWIYGYPQKKADQDARYCTVIRVRLEDYSNNRSG